MLSRALSLATVMLLIGFCAAERAQAQENLEAGKSPSQIFANTCAACHKGSRGLLKTVAPGSLPSFLREHYTTSPAMAGVLASYLISNGATDTRISGGQPKGAKEGAKDGSKEAKQEGRPDQRPAEQLDRFGRRLRPATAGQEIKPEAEPRQEPKQAARPENEGPQSHRRLARPAEAPEGAKPDMDGQLPAQVQVGPDGRKLSVKQRLSKRGKPGGEELPKAEEPLANEPPKAESATKDEGRPEEAKPAVETPSQSAKVEPARESGGETSTLRTDPVAPVIPAPPSTTSAVSGSGGSESAAAPTVSAPPVAVTGASAPPVAPAGPPAPPISQ